MKIEKEIMKKPKEEIQYISTNFEVTEAVTNFLIVQKASASEQFKAFKYLGSNLRSNKTDGALDLH